MFTPIAISRIHFPVTTLGPGARIGIWTQGCSIQCPGCISVDTWQRARETISVEAVMEAIEPFFPEATGVTVTGGEPFDQPSALGELLRALRASMPGDRDILVYSGHRFSEVEQHLCAWPGLIDALISEPFEIDSPQTRPLTGSDNQQLHLLTALGEQRFQSYQRNRKVEDDRLDLMVDVGGTAWLAGIPKRGDLARLQALLQSQGTAIQTSEHRMLPR